MNNPDLERLLELDEEIRNLTDTTDNYKWQSKFKGVIKNYEKRLEDLKLKRQQLKDKINQALDENNRYDKGSVSMPKSDSSQIITFKEALTELKILRQNQHNDECKKALENFNNLQKNYDQISKDERELGRRCINTENKLQQAEQKLQKIEAKIKKEINDLKSTGWKNSDWRIVSVNTLEKLQAILKEGKE